MAEQENALMEMETSGSGTSLFDQTMQIMG